MKKQLIIGVGTALVLLGFVIYLFFFMRRPPGPIVNCGPASGFGNREDTLVCYNNIYVNKVAPCPYDEDADLKGCGETYIFNERRTLDVVNEVKAFRVQGHLIYAIGDLQYAETEDANGIKKLLGIYQINGTSTPVEVGSRDDIQRYFIVDAITENFSIYKSLKEMPQEARKIFEDLEAN